MLISSERVAVVVRTVAQTAVSHDKLRKLRQLADGWPASVAGAGRTPPLDRVVLARLWLTHLVQLWLFTRGAFGSRAVRGRAASLSAVALMAGQVPFTVAGLGARDVVLVVLLARYMTPESAAAMGVLISTRGCCPR